MIKLFLLALVFSSTAYAEKASDKEGEKLTLEMVLNSSKKHYPLILESLKDVDAAKMKIQEAFGAFDMKLKSKADFREQGYYDGKSADFLLEKPLPYMNSRIYMGHRVSEGDYPSYEGKRVTLDEGESRVGLALSLWQDRDIDPRRLQVAINKLELSNKELKVLKNQIKVIQSATKAYWKWVAAGNTYKVYDNLLKISIDRDKALSKRIAKGDLAKIYQIENQQYILKRKTQVIDALQKYQSSSLNLSLFLRDEKGNPLIAANSLLPEKMQAEKKITQEDLNKAKEIVLKQNPELIKINNKIEQFKYEESFGENKLKPRIDLHLEISKDQGEGSDTLREQENRGFLKIEIPIERNLGAAKRAKAKYKQQSLAYKKQLLREKLEVDMQKNFYQLNASVEKIKNTRQEVTFAETLQKAEVKKFESGASDFFVVNIREQNTADAKVKYIKAHLEYKKSLANYQAITMAVLNQ